MPNSKFLILVYNSTVSTVICIVCMFHDSLYQNIHYLTAAVLYYSKYICQVSAETFLHIVIGALEVQTICGV